MKAKDLFNDLGFKKYIHSNTFLVYLFETDCYDEMFKSGNTIIRSFTNKIAELQKQLEEKDKEHELLINDFEEETENLRKQIKRESDARKRFVKKVEELKQQLSEKEKEIEQYKETIKEWVGTKFVKLQNQKAIEQLNQIINLFEPYENEEKDTILCANNGISFLEYIDQQIALLEGKAEYVKN